MSSKNVEAYTQAHQAFNARDFDTAVGFMAENVVYHDRARAQTFKGRAGFKDFMQGWVAAFSNSAVTDPVYLDAGDTVIAQFVGKGNNDGPLGPLPPTGKPINFPLCEVMRFDKNGQVVSGEIYYDQLSLLVQLGHAQAPAR